MLMFKQHNLAGFWPLVVHLAERSATDSCQLLPGLASAFQTAASKCVFDSCASLMETLSAQQQRAQAKPKPKPNTKTRLEQSSRTRAVLGLSLSLRVPNVLSSLSAGSSHARLTTNKLFESRAHSEGWFPTAAALIGNSDDSNRIFGSNRIS